MNRLIDLQTALDLLEKDINENGEPPESDYNIGINHARCVISTIPSAQPQRMRGRWMAVQHGDDDGFIFARCTVCKWDSEEAFELAQRRFKFCPNCGSYNGGEQNEVD